jgi:hypothetical protein
MSAKALDLFQAFQENTLPLEGGYIVSSFFDSNSTYSRYEVVSYSGVKNVFASEEGLTFQSDGKKLFILVEPSSYPRKQLEPVYRDKNESIPHRYKELTIFTCKDQTKVMVSNEPVQSYSAFTILRPTSINFALVFFPAPDILDTMEFFFQKTLNREAGVPQINANSAAKTISQGIAKLLENF